MAHLENDKNTILNQKERALLLQKARDTLQSLRVSLSNGDVFYRGGVFCPQTVMANPNDIGSDMEGKTVLDIGKPGEKWKVREQKYIGGGRFNK